MAARRRGGGRLRARHALLPRPRRGLRPPREDPARPGPPGMRGRAARALARRHARLRARVLLGGVSARHPAGRSRAPRASARTAALRVPPRPPVDSGGRPRPLRRARRGGRRLARGAARSLQRLRALRLHALPARGRGAEQPPRGGAGRRRPRRPLQARGRPAEPRGPCGGGGRAGAPLPARRVEGAASLQYGLPCGRAPRAGRAEDGLPHRVRPGEVRGMRPLHGRLQGAVPRRTRPRRRQCALRAVLQLPRGLPEGRAGVPSAAGLGAAGGRAGKGAPRLPRDGGRGPGRRRRGGVRTADGAARRVRHGPAAAGVGRAAPPHAVYGVRALRGAVPAKGPCPGGILGLRPARVHAAEDGLCARLLRSVLHGVRRRLPDGGDSAPGRRREEDGEGRARGLRPFGVPRLHGEDPVRPLCPPLSAEGDYAEGRGHP